MKSDKVVLYSKIIQKMQDKTELCDTYVYIFIVTFLILFRVMDLNL